MAIEIVDFPIKHGDNPLVMFNYQRVNDLFRHFPGSDRCVQRSSSMLLWQIDH